MSKQGAVSNKLIAVCANVLMRHYFLWQNRLKTDFGGHPAKLAFFSADTHIHEFVHAEASKGVSAVPPAIV